MRRASPLLFGFFIACAVSGCATARTEAVPQAPELVSVAAPQRGAELYGRYCTGCHSGAVRTNIARAGAPFLMHIQARVGMGTMPAGISETVTSEDARLIVDYLDSGRDSRQVD